VNCAEAKVLIDAYADGELDPVRAQELEAHVRECPDCAAALLKIQALKKAARQDAFFFRAPAEFRRELKKELRAQAGPEVKPAFWSGNWLALFSTGVAVVCLTLLLTVNVARPPAQASLDGEIVSSHIRSLMANHALDVVSTDQHTVKPWFDGKLDFAPPVKDLAAQGFPLIGGRLDYLNGRAVAALVFQRKKHVLNLFIWPANDAETTPAAAPPRQGYNLVHWSQGGMTFWAVSDLNEGELLEFSRDFGSK
jgi:anti-sigma factor RsiW